MKKNNKKGFSLVELLVVMGLLGVGSMMVMKMTQTQLKSQRTAESGYEINAIVNEIRAILSDPENCKETFKKVILPENVKEEVIINVKKKVKNDFVEKFEVGKRYGQGKVKINNYNLSIEGLPVDSNEADLLISFYRGRLGHSKSISKKISLQVGLDANDEIVECFASSSGVSMVWQRDPDNFNTINYSSGPVTLGNKIKKTYLTVNGPIIIGHDDDDACSDTAQNDEGKIRYNHNKKNMEFCDGEKWKAFGEVAFHAGAIKHGGVIPIPQGYTESECKWIVSMRNGGSSINYRTNEYIYTADRPIPSGPHAIGQWGSAQNRGRYVIVATGNSAANAIPRTGWANYLVVCKH